MIKYKDFKVEDLVSWIKSKAAERNKSVLLIEFDGTIASIVNILLCKKTGLPTHTVINFDYYKNNHPNLKYICDFLKTDFQILDTNSYIEDWEPLYDINDKRIKYVRNNSYKNELEEFVKISYIAETTNSLVLSNITRDEYLFVRNYPRLNPWDIMPFADLSMATVNSLIDKLISVKTSEIIEFIRVAPKPNLEIEWLYGANERSRPFPELGPSIICSEEDPTKNPKWYTYTISQKTLIAKVHQIEKATRYKVNSNIPIFKLEIIDND